MGSIYRPKYKNGAGELVEVAVWWLKLPRQRADRPREHVTENDEGADRPRAAAREGRRRERGLLLPRKVNRKTVAELLAGVVQDYQINERRSTRKLEDRIRLHLLPVLRQLECRRA